MSIRKTGAATGQVTEVEEVPQEGIAVTGSLSGSEGEQAAGWTVPDEAALASENEAADQ